MPCYEPVIATLGRQILQEDGTINNKKMAEAIFASSEKLAQINAIIHPAVRTYIMEQIRLERESGVNDFFFLEAALLIEEHYDEVVDELWYVYASEQVRYKRLKDSRGYSDERQLLLSAGSSRMRYSAANVILCWTIPVILRIQNSR